MMFYPSLGRCVYLLKGCFNTNGCMTCMSQLKLEGASGSREELDELRRESEGVKLGPAKIGA